MSSYLIDRRLIGLALFCSASVYAQDTFVTDEMVKQGEDYIQMACDGQSAEICKQAHDTQDMLLRMRREEIERNASRASRAQRSTVRVSPATASSAPFGPLEEGVGTRVQRDFWRDKCQNIPADSSSGAQGCRQTLQMLRGQVSGTEQRSAVPGGGMAISPSASAGQTATRRARLTRRSTALHSLIKTAMSLVAHAAPEPTRSLLLTMAT